MYPVAKKAGLLRFSGSYFPAAAMASAQASRSVRRDASTVTAPRTAYTVLREPSSPGVPPTSVCRSYLGLQRLAPGQVRAATTTRMPGADESECS